MRTKKRLATTMCLLLACVSLTSIFMCQEEHNPGIKNDNSMLLFHDDLIFEPSTTLGNSNQTGDEWPMFHASLNHTGTVTTQIVGGEALWSNSSYHAYSSPAVVNGYLFMGSLDDNVYCVNASTGEKIWNYTTGEPVHSTPAIAENHVYVGSNDNNIYCLNVATGGKIWNYITGGSVESSPAIASGFIYVGSDDGKVYCLNATNGAKNWSSPSGFVVDSSPAVAGGFVYVGCCDHNIYCLNATTGKKIWNYTTGGSVESSPAIASGCIYVGSDDGKVYCLNANTGALKWSYTTKDGVFSSPAVASGLIYVGSKDDNLYCLNAANGAKMWNYSISSSVYSSPVVADGYIYVGNVDGNMCCLNATTGTRIWGYEVGYDMESSPAIANGCVYVGSSYGSLYCLPMSISVPSAPENLVASQEMIGLSRMPDVDLSWQPPANNGELSITGYNIYKGNSSGTEALYFSLGNVTTFTDIFVTWRTTYYYKVTAVNAAGESVLSTEASVEPLELPGFPVASITGLLAITILVLAISTWRKHEWQ